MIKFITDLYSRMSKALEELAMISDNILQRAVQSRKIVEQTLGELKEFIIHYTFNDEHEEIKFFKEIKPMFLKELIYYKEIFQVEAWKPPVDNDDISMHYKIGTKRVDLFLKMHNDLYTYYRTGSSEHDELYFLRNQTPKDLIGSISIWDIDQRFSTIHSFQFAKIQAYESFGNYLYQRMYQLENPGQQLSDVEKDAPRLVWTDPKTFLIEVGYTIYVNGSVNYGKAKLKDIMTVLELGFNVDLGNYNRSFANMSIRKKNITPYLDIGKENLGKYMNS